jgi:hypothetical protein
MFNHQQAPAPVVVVNGQQGQPGVQGPVQVIQQQPVDQGHGFMWYTGWLFVFIVVVIIVVGVM